MSSAMTITMNFAHFPTFPTLHLRQTHSPTLLLLHLRHSSFSNPSFASPTSQALHLIHLASSPCSRIMFCNSTQKLRVCQKFYLHIVDPGGLELSYPPLDQRLSGSIPARVDGFFSERKNPRYDFLRKGSKAVGPAS